MVQGQIFLKGEAGTSSIYFFQGLSFLHLEITLSFAKLCYTLHCAIIILWKKVIRSFLKMNLKISHELIFISLFVLSSPE